MLWCLNLFWPMKKVNILIIYKMLTMFYYYKNVLMGWQVDDLKWQMCKRRKMCCHLNMSTRKTTRWKKLWNCKKMMQAYPVDSQGCREGNHHWDGHYWHCYHQLGGRFNDNMLFVSTQGQNWIRQHEAFNICRHGSVTSQRKKQRVSRSCQVLFQCQEICLASYKKIILITNLTIGVTCNSLL